MLDGNDVDTLQALSLLTDSVSAGSRPLVIWMGAGASAWADYPLWNELADTMNSVFLRYEPDYDKQAAIELIDSKRLPEYFQLCKDVNQQRYFSVLADALRARKTTPVYDRLIDTLKAIAPIYVVTTNVDELLENNLTAVTTLQKTDLERCIELLQELSSKVVYEVKKKVAYS